MCKDKAAHITKYKKSLPMFTSLNIYIANV